MGLYEQWQQLTEAQMSQAQNNAFWKDYLEKEKDNYSYILENRISKLEGRLADLAETYNESCSVRRIS